MKYYVYISESKINMLYDQIEAETNVKSERSWGINIGLFKAEEKSSSGIPENKITKLNKILEELTKSDLVGDIDSKAPFVRFEGTLTQVSTRSMSKAFNLIYWGGSSSDGRTHYGFNGSTNNVVGNEGKGEIGHSMSDLYEFIHFLENTDHENKEASYLPDESLPWLLRQFNNECLLGEKSQYHLVAKVLHRGSFTYNGNQTIKSIIASPLFVAYSN